MKKEKFLNFIEQTIQNRDIVYYDSDENLFYFYYNNLKVDIGSNESSAYISLTDTKTNNKESLSLTYEDTVQLTTLCLDKVSNNNSSYQYIIDRYGQQRFNDTLNLFDEFLKNINPIEAIKKADQLHRYVLDFPLDGRKNICRLGNIANYKGKKNVVLTSVIKVPLFIVIGNNQTDGCIPYEKIIPSWQAKEYPILLNFLNVKLFNSDFDEAFSRIQQNFSDGKELYFDILNTTIENKSQTTKPKKI